MPWWSACEWNKLGVGQRYFRKKRTSGNWRLGPSIGDGSAGVPGYHSGKNRDCVWKILLSSAFWPGNVSPMPRVWAFLNTSTMGRPFPRVPSASQRRSQAPSLEMTYVSAASSFPRTCTHTRFGAVWIDRRRSPVSKVKIGLVENVGHETTRRPIVEGSERRRRWRCPSPAASRHRPDVAPPRRPRHAQQPRQVSTDNRAHLQTALPITSFRLYDVGEGNVS